MNNILKMMFMLANKVKGFIRKVTQAFPITLIDCVDNDSLIGLTIEGNCFQDGIPTFDVPIEIQSVGERTVNLLPYPYAHTTKTVNGITFTDNGDGTITANGTSDASAYFQFNYGSAGRRTLLKAGTYKISGNPLNASLGVLMHMYLYETQESASSSNIYTPVNDETVTFTIDSDMYYYWYISITSGTTVDNITFSPMLRKADTEDNGYEPYGYKIPVVASSINILPYPYPFINKTTISNGITFTDNGDGSISVKGTSTGNYAQVILNNTIELEAGKTYKIINNGLVTNLIISYTNEQGNTVYVSTNNGYREFTWNENYTLQNIYLQVYPKGTEVDETIYPMLCLADVTVDKYYPYEQPITTDIYLNNPLRYKDELNCEDKSVTRNYGYIVLDSSYAITPYSYVNANYNAEYYGFVVAGIGMSNSNRVKGFCSHAYSTPDISDAVWFGTQSNVIYIINKDLYDLGKDGLCEWLDEQKANGTPFELIYPLAKPITEKIIAPDLPTFKGGTIYSIDTTVQPLSGTVEYYSTTKGE